MTAPSSPGFILPPSAHLRRAKQDLVKTNKRFHRSSLELSLSCPWLWQNSSDKQVKGSTVWVHNFKLSTHGRLAFIHVVRYKYYRGQQLTLGSKTGQSIPVKDTSVPDRLGTEGRLAHFLRACPLTNHQRVQLLMKLVSSWPSHFPEPWPMWQPSPSCLCQFCARGFCLCCLSCQQCSHSQALKLASRPSVIPPMTLSCGRLWWAFSHLKPLLSRYSADILSTEHYWCR